MEHSPAISVAEYHHVMGQVEYSPATYRAELSHATRDTKQGRVTCRARYGLDTCQVKIESHASSNELQLTVCFHLSRSTLLGS